MTPDYVYVYEHDTVEDVLNTIRKYAKNSETIDVIYVINDKGELLDDIRIREFILAAPDKKVSELMDDRVIALNAYDDQEVANEAFKMNNRVALPVEPGRDVAGLIELAAMNYKLRAFGHNSAVEFDQRLLKKMSDDQLG